MKVASSFPNLTGTPNGSKFKRKSEALCVQPAKIPEKSQRPRIEKLEVEVPQANHSAENSDNSANKVQWNRDFREDVFEKFVITNNFVLPIRKNRQKTGPFTTWNFRIPKES